MPKLPLEPPMLFGVRLADLPQDLSSMCRSPIDRDVSLPLSSAGLLPQRRDAAAGFLATIVVVCLAVGALELVDDDRVIDSTPTISSVIN